MKDRLLCIYCHTQTNLVKASKSKTTQYYECRPCRNARRRAYTKTPHGRLKTYESLARYYAKVCGYKLVKL